MGRDRWKQAQLPGLSDSVSRRQEVIWPIYCSRLGLTLEAQEPLLGHGAWASVVPGVGGCAERFWDGP